MTKVYFSKNIEQILEKLDYSKLGNNVAIKVHFGEKGCVTFIDPVFVKKIYEAIENFGKKVALVECNVLYKGGRTNSTDHLKIAREHGFRGMNIDILDGENGQESIDINGCKIGKGIRKYDSLIVFSHFKGHDFTGFGGALKNVGMGLGSRVGKLDMHSKVKPYISEKCVGCGKCIEHCNAKAIEISGGKARIDEKKCEGCAMCIAVCPTSAARIPWRGRTAEEIQLRIAQYAKAILSQFKNPIYINVLRNITEECDCNDTVQVPIMEDIGFLYSDDIVAIEQASLDLADKFSGGKFSQINEVDKYKQIDSAEKIGLGSGKYELINL